MDFRIYTYEFVDAAYYSFYFVEIDRAFAPRGWML